MVMFHVVISFTMYFKQIGARWEIVTTVGLTHFLITGFTSAAAEIVTYFCTVRNLFIVILDCNYRQFFKNALLHIIKYELSYF